MRWRAALSAGAWVTAANDSTVTMNEIRTSEGANAMKLRNSAADSENYGRA